MRSFKNIFLLLTTLFVLSFVSCGKDDYRDDYREPEWSDNVEFNSDSKHLTYKTTGKNGQVFTLQFDATSYEGRGSVIYKTESVIMDSNFYDSIKFKNARNSFASITCMLNTVTVGFNAPNMDEVLYDYFPDEAPWIIEFSSSSHPECNFSYEIKSKYIPDIKDWVKNVELDP